MAKFWSMDNLVVAVLGDSEVRPDREAMREKERVALSSRSYLPGTSQEVPLARLDAPALRANQVAAPPLKVT
jgi:hypothetical protein